MRKIYLTLMVLMLATLAAQAADPINIAGKDCKCDKDYTYTASDITDLKSGTITYTYSTNTLTLTNVTISRTGSSNYCIHNRSKKGLTVKFVGTCNLTAEGRVIRDQSGGTNYLEAASGVTVNLKSTGDGAIYVRDNTTLWIQGPGTYNITGPKNGAIAGHGSWNATTSDPATTDYINFYNVTAIVTGAQSSLLGLKNVSFGSSCNVTLKATNNSSYPVTRQIKGCSFTNGNVILAPWGAEYSSSSESIVLNGSKVYNQDIVVSPNYALLLNSTNFPDANFRNAMLALYPKGYLTTTELNNLTYLNVAGKSISNMTGIEKLTKLKDLRCYNNSFTSLNLNSNTALTYLDCAPNTNLTSLSIGNCTNLETLTCYNTGISSLSLSNLSKLKSLSCYNTKLTGLTVSNKSYLTSVNCSNCTSLTSLYCTSNSSLTTLNVTGNTTMTYLSCSDNSNLSSITGLAGCSALKKIYCYSTGITDLSAVNSLSNLETLYCADTKISSLTLTNKSKLTEVYCYDCPQLTTVSIYGNSALTTLTNIDCPALTTLYCPNNNLNAISVSGCTALNYLSCYGNSSLPYITDLYRCTALKEIYCYNTSISNLGDCNNLSNLVKLHCYGTKITQLTLTNKSKLTEVYCYNNPSLTTANIYSNSALTTLDVRNCTALTALTCSLDKLTTLNVTGNTALQTLNCCYNYNLATITGLANCTAITELQCFSCALTDLSACNRMNNLQKLYCYSNKLTSLTLTNKTKLSHVEAQTNSLLTTAEVASNSALKTLNISNCTALNTLSCNNNALTTLNVSGNTALTSLQCYRNSLTSLDVSTLTNLTHLNCQNNQLTSLNVTNNALLQSLYCDDNKLTSLNVSGKTALTRIQCFDNQLTSLNVQGCSALYILHCEDNKLTSLSVQGCTALRYLDCYLNNITGDGMTMLVNSLPMCTSSDPGTMTLQWYYDEGNVINAAQCATARAKYWNPRRYDGSNYIDIVFESIRGDVDGDGNVTVADVTALIDLILAGGATVDTYPAADADGDGRLTIADGTAMIDYLLHGAWNTPTDTHKWVNLGLPSGTLWATCNVGAGSPEEYGYYFAWGEVEPKKNYSWSTYKWCNGTNITLTKYCTKSSCGTVDNKTELDPEDDAAYVNWGSSWRMPTLDQIQELCEECSWTWTTLNGVNGWKATGPSGATLFLPAAGLHVNDSFNSGDFAHYWTRTLYENDPESAFFLSFDSGSVQWNTLYKRFYGRSVRPVRVSQ